MKYEQIETDLSFFVTLEPTAIAMANFRYCKFAHCTMFAKNLPDGIATIYCGSLDESRAPKG